MSPTLEQVAALAGVSRSTVSRVINGHPSVDPETRERVLRIVQEQDYHPNAAARTLAGRRSQLIGLVVPQTMSAVFADPYFPQLIQGVSTACEERDYFMLLSFPGRAAERYAHARSCAALTLTVWSWQLR